MPEASGATHEVGVDQIFFSTTDARGVIRHSNNVFIELSRYSRQQLSGAPHNIIRHPEMPGGAFKAMWDTLQAGSPFAAYVRNLAADGSEYAVFATVTPLSDGGYLSVRTRPTRDDLFETACAIYRDARAVEGAAIEAGDNRREASVKGLGRIAEMLAAAGLSSYEDFQNAALPAEVARREELSEGIPQRPGATGDLAEMLSSVSAISKGLDSWMAGQGELAELSAALKSAGTSLTESLADSRLTAATLDRGDARVKPLADLLDLWTQMQGIVSPLVNRLVESLARLDTNGARTRFRIALARLHATITALFTVELIDDVGETRYSAESIPDLIESLAAGLEEMERAAEAHRALSAQAVATIGEASRMMAIPNQLLMLWTGSPASKDPQLPATAAGLSAAASGVVETVRQRLAELDALAASCQRLDLAAGASDLRGHLATLTRAAASAAPSSPSRRPLP
ncbi:PAS domain-containing protein [Actinomyces timonensis]|uniref:PAS domain-containing protein n=1 Tax=Actinomyces timonensis TaxID=1288391 RepID=A0AAU8N404_9ACTO